MSNAWVTQNTRAIMWANTRKTVRKIEWSRKFRLTLTFISTKTIKNLIPKILLTEKKISVSKRDASVCYVPDSKWKQMMVHCYLSNCKMNCLDVYTCGKEFPFLTIQILHLCLCAQESAYSFSHSSNTVAISKCCL